MTSFRSLYRATSGNSFPPDAGYLPSPDTGRGCRRSDHEREGVTRIVGWCAKNAVMPVEVANRGGAHRDTIRIAFVVSGNEVLN